MTSFLINESNGIKFENLSTIIEIRINSIIGGNVVLIPTRMSNIKERKDALIKMLN